MARLNPAPASSPSSVASAIAPPTAGIDRILLSAPRLALADAHALTDAELANLPGYTGGQGTPIERHASYDMMARLRPRRSGDPLVEVYYHPLRRYMPALQVAVQAPATGYADDLTHVVDLVATLERRLGVRLTVSELEVAIDFRGDIALLRALQRQLLVPRTTSHWSYGNTLYWGRGDSARQLRMYWRLPSRPPCPRLEVVLRRTVLRRLGVRYLPDVGGRRWVDYCGRAFQLVEPRPPRRANATAVADFLRNVGTIGATIAVQMVPVRRRFRMRAYLQPSATDILVRDALAHMSLRLRPWR